VCSSDLRELGQETHLIISAAGEINIGLETDSSLDQVKALAQAVHRPEDLAAPLASGSFPTRGMIVAPCSVKTLSAIANSYAADLIVRAADVTLKEGRRLVLMVRETPLHQGHLELMARAARLGAVILPPIPAFYHRPRTIEDLVRQSVGKALDQLGIEHRLFTRWGGDSPE
jgi:4-hydroxy-3-polyprenylbenzoate decarboxylase